MIETHPSPIAGRWREGWALDIHTLGSTHIGDDEFGHAQFETTRSAAGELLYRLKYRGDESALGELVEAAAEFYRTWKPQAEAIVPVPPSRQRPQQPVMALAAALSKELALPFAPAAVRRVRDVPELKNVFGYDERTGLLAGAHTVDAGVVAGKRILLFDDLFRSGATMNSITAALYDQGGAAEVCALTLTRTRSKQ